MKTLPRHMKDRDFLYELAMDILEGERKGYIDLTLEFVDVRKGVCSHKPNGTYRVTIPVAAKRVSESYLYAYLIHEISHVVAGYGHNHDAYFKSIEKRLLNKYMGITRVEYKKAYIKKLVRGDEVVFSYS